MLKSQIGISLDLLWQPLKCGLSLIWKMQLLRLGGEGKRADYELLREKEYNVQQKLCYLGVNKKTHFPSVCKIVSKLCFCLKKKKDCKCQHKKKKNQPIQNVIFSGYLPAAVQTETQAAHCLRKLHMAVSQHVPVSVIWSHVSSVIV